VLKQDAFLSDARIDARRLLSVMHSAKTLSMLNGTHTYTMRCMECTVEVLCSVFFDMDVMITFFS
jgi:hypothetical protein